MKRRGFRTIASLLWAYRVIAVTSAAQEVRQGTAELAEINFVHGALARQTLCVIDDEGNPVFDAKVQISFVMPGCQWIYGQTDTNGFFSAQGQSGGKVNYYVQKSGYYPSSGTLNIDNKDGVVVKDGKWQPWNPEVKVVLRRIVNPIPMYARNVSVMIPRIGEPCGFDLFIGDWIAPYGIGKETDISVEVNREIERDDDYVIRLTVRSSSVFDGLQPAAEFPESRNERL